jgi:hypothetical protein
MKKFIMSVFTYETTIWPWTGAAFLGAFAKFANSHYQLRHGCLSVRTQQVGSHSMDFDEI